jgi:hypothetical protein
MRTPVGASDSHFPRTGRNSLRPLCFAELASRRSGGRAVRLKGRHDRVLPRNDCEVFASRQIDDMDVEAVADLGEFGAMSRSGFRLTGGGSARHLCCRSTFVAVVGIRQRRFHIRAQETERGEK